MFEILTNRISLSEFESVFAIKVTIDDKSYSAIISKRDESVNLPFNVLVGLEPVQLKALSDVHKELWDKIDGKWLTDMDDPAVFFQTKSKDLPGMDTMVRNPVTNQTEKLHQSIIYLNDHAGWSRDLIATWVERLGIDITFRRQR